MLNRIPLLKKGEYPPRDPKFDFHVCNDPDVNEKRNYNLIEVLFSYPMNDDDYNKLLDLCANSNISYGSVGLSYIDFSRVDSPDGIIKKIFKKNPGIFAQIKYNCYTKGLIDNYYEMAKKFVLYCHYHAFKSINENCLSDQEYAELAYLSVKKRYANLYDINLKNPAIDQIKIFYIAVNEKSFAYDGSISSGDDRKMCELYNQLPYTKEAKKESEKILSLIIKKRNYYSNLELYKWQLKKERFDNLVLFLAKKTPELIVYATDLAIVRCITILYDAIKKCVTTNRRFHSSCYQLFKEIENIKIADFNFAEVYENTAKIARDFFDNEKISCTCKNDDTLESDDCKTAMNFNYHDRYEALRQALIVINNAKTISDDIKKSLIEKYNLEEWKADYASIKHNHH
jgi:hypothetical protein